MTRLTVITVAYQSYSLIEDLLDALEGLPAIVADNSTDLEDLTELLARYRGVKHLDTGGNVGFAAAANAAARLADSDYVAFVNPDARPTAKDLADLTAFLDSHPSVAAVGPALVDSRGSSQPNAGGWDIGIRRASVHALGLHKQMGSAGIWFAADRPVPVDVDWVAGTCLVARSKAFLDAGGFDESYFLYQEDVELGKRLRELGYRLVVDGRVRVAHVGGASSDGPVDLPSHRVDSLIQHVRRHSSAPRASLILLILGAGAWARFVVYSLRGEHRSAAEQRLTALALHGLFRRHGDLGSE